MHADSFGQYVYSEGVFRGTMGRTIVPWANSSHMPEPFGISFGRHERAYLAFDTEVRFTLEEYKELMSSIAHWREGIYLFLIFSILWTLYPSPDEAFQPTCHSAALLSAFYLYRRERSECPPRGWRVACVSTLF